MGSGSSSTTQGFVDQTEQTSNGGADYTPHGDPIDVGGYTRLAIYLHIINGPESGTTTVRIEESPNYGFAGVANEQAHWMSLKSFDPVDVNDAGAWFKMELPDGTINTWGAWLRVTAVNSVSGQTCLFEVKINRY